MVFPTGW